MWGVAYVCFFNNYVSRGAIKLDGNAAAFDTTDDDNNSID